MSRARTPSQKRPAILATSVAALLSLGLLLAPARLRADEYWDGTTTIGSNITHGKGGDGTWDNSTTNWLNSSNNPTSYVSGQTAHFATMPGVVTIGENIAFTSLEFDADGYTIAPNGGTPDLSLIPTGAATITAENGVTVAISAPITGTGSLVISGPAAGNGIVALYNANTYSGGTTLGNNATLYVNGNTALGTGPLTISGTHATFGTQFNRTEFSNPISVMTSSFSIGDANGGSNLFIDGAINLNGGNGAAQTTITGTGLPKEQIQFGPGGIGVAGDPTGVIFTTSFVGPGAGGGNYVAFITETDNVNHYTGLTTITGNAFLVLQGDTAGGSIKGNVDIEQTGVLDYDLVAGSASAQINNPNAVVTVNSMGSIALGQAFAGFELYLSSGDTIGTLNGSGAVSLAAGTLTLSNGTFSGQITNGGLTSQSGVLTGGGLKKTSAGTFVLSGTDNTYSGATTITGGAVQAGATDAFSPNSAVVIATGGTLDLNGFNQVVASIADQTTGTSKGTINLGAGTLTTGADGTSTQFSGVIQGSGGLSKIGKGTLTLAGVNTYTGVTSVLGGALDLTPSSPSALSTVLNSGSALVLGGGTLELSGPSGATTQVLNGLTVGQGASQVTVDNSGTSTTLDLSGVSTTAGISRNAGGVLDFNSNAADFGVVGATDAVVRTGQANDATGIIGAWATVNHGAALAANDGAGNIVAYAAYAKDTDTANVIQSSPVANVIMLGGDDTLANSPGTTSINTLTQNSGTASTVDTGGGTLQVGAGTAGGVGAVFITPTGASLTIGTSANSGVLTAGGGSTGELILENNSTSTANILTINSTIQDNGSGSVSVTVAGSGTTVLNGSNTYTGQTLVTAGTLQLGSTSAIPSNSAVVVQGGTLNLNGNSVTVTSLSDGGSNAGTIALSSASTGGTLTVGGSASTTYSGLITDGGTGFPGGSLVMSGTGSLTLSNPSNSYSGGTTLNSGTLVVNGSPVDGSGTPLGTGTLTINGGTLGTTIQPGNSGAGTTLNNAVTINNSFNIFTNSNSADVLTENFSLNGPITLGTSSTITGQTAGSTVHFGGAIGDNGHGFGLTFATNNAVQSDPTHPYVIFEYQGSTANTYTGATVVTTGAVLFLNSASGTAAPADVQVTGNGVVLIGNPTGSTPPPNQLSSSASVDVESPGNTIGGVKYDGLELAGNSQTIMELNGTSAAARVGLGSGTLTVSGGVFNGVIEDGTTGAGGSLVVTTGTLQLGGVNTYTGSTLINGGILQATVADAVPSKSAVALEGNGTFDLNGNDQSIGSLSDGATGNTGTVDLGTNTLTVGNDNSDGFLGTGVFSGTISGTTGRLIKVGGGFLDLTGTGNSYTGPTLVNGGTLEVDGTITSPVTVTGATFVLGSTGTVNTGAGSTPVTLETGATFNNSGSLSTAAPGFLVGVAAQGPGDMINNAALISGVTGIVVSNPSGLVQIFNQGTITGTGGTAIDASTSAGLRLINLGVINGKVLFGSGPSTLVVATGSTPSPVTGGGAKSTLELAGGGVGDLNLGDYPNFATLDKVGGGEFTLTGSGAFPGGTNIENGTINLLGALKSNVVIQPLGELTGIGTIFGSVVNIGMVQPGAGLIGSPLNINTIPGTLHVEGNFTQGDFGQLILQVGGSRPGEYSTLQIGGHAFLGGTLILQQINKGPNLSLGESIPLITAFGGVSGGFNQIINPLTSDTVVYSKVLVEPYAVVLEGEQGSFAGIQARGVPLTANETAVATALDRVSAGANKPSGDAAKLIGYLDELPIQNLPADFDKIAPAQVASVYRLGVSLADVQSTNLQRRTSDLRAGASGFNSAGYQTSGGPGYIAGLAGPNGADGRAATPAAAATDLNWGGFITGVGDFIHVGSTVNSTSYNLDTGGITLGVDYKLTDNFAVGFTAGYAGTNSSLADNGRLLVNGGRAGVYGTYWQDGFYGDVMAGGGYNDYQIRRGALQGDANGSTAGATVDVVVAGGYDWRLEGLTIGPTASLEYTYLGLDAFSERGSLAPLRYPSQYNNSVRSTLGIRASYDWKIGNVLVRPEAEIAWQREFGSPAPSIDASLESGPGNLFSVTDSEIGRNDLTLGGGVSVLWNPRTSTYLYYDADILRKEYYSQSITGGLRLNF